MSEGPVPAGEVTRLLIALREGDASAFDRLLPLVYDELRRVAQHQLRRHRPSPTVEATGLVHDVYLKLADQKRLQARDRAHFLAIAARAMRQLIVDRARRRGAEKRGGERPSLSLDEVRELGADEPARLIELDAALGRLPERLAQVVECRFFAGYSEQETALALDSSLRTVQRDWQRARAWLHDELGDPTGRGAAGG